MCISYINYSKLLTTKKQALMGILYTGVDCIQWSICLWCQMTVKAHAPLVMESNFCFPIRHSSDYIDRSLSLVVQKM